MLMISKYVPTVLSLISKIIVPGSEHVLMFNKKRIYSLEPDIMSSTKKKKASSSEHHSMESNKKVYVIIVSNGMMDPTISVYGSSFCTV